MNYLTPEQRTNQSQHIKTLIYKQNTVSLLWDKHFVAVLVPMCGLGGHSKCIIFCCLWQWLAWFAFWYCCCLKLEAGKSINRAVSDATLRAKASYGVWNHNYRGFYSEFLLPPFHSSPTALDRINTHSKHGKQRMHPLKKKLCYSTWALSNRMLRNKTQSGWSGGSGNGSFLKVKLCISNRITIGLVLHSGNTS